MELKDKIAVVTGVSSGLGSAITEALIKNGAEVYGLARNESKLKQLKEKFGEKFHVCKVDISKLDQITEWIDRNFSDSHSPDILVNNAGIGSLSMLNKLCQI